VTAQPPGVSRDVEGERNFDGVSPMLSVQREFTTGDLVYLLYSEGFRAGGFNTGGFLWPIRAPRAQFKSDRLRNYELGAKARLLDSRLSTRGAVFYNTWQNVQSEIYRPSGVAFTGNAGDARVLGLEAEIAYEFDFGLSIQANGLLADTDMTRRNPEFSLTSTLIDELPGVPRFSGGVLVVYERPIASGTTLRLAGETSYVGQSAVSFETARAWSQGDYLRARLSAELANERWSASVFVNNPGNAAGDTFAYGNPFIYTLANGRLVTPQRPRTLGVRLAAAF
jgi:outer membrane receptor protein involved in Fe transport